jgi:hypothetical protein
METGLLEAPKSYQSAEAVVTCEGYKTGLTVEDFWVVDVAGFHMRKTAKEIQEILKGRGFDLETRQIAYRRKKLIKHGVMAPFLWFAYVGLHYAFTVEIVCSQQAIQKIIDVMKGFPEVVPLITDRGVILSLLFPSYHLSDYYQFFSKLLEMDGVESIKPILASERSFGKNYIDIFGNLEFGAKGFSDSSSDVDIASFVL